LIEEEQRNKESINKAGHELKVLSTVANDTVKVIQNVYTGFSEQIEMVISEIHF